MPPNGIITLTTDFGFGDGYVAMMKGVILGIARHAMIVDYTHDIAPQAIGEGAYLIHAGYRYFPLGTIHVVVVDPGVGSDRRAIAIGTPEAIFIGPDNGVLATVFDDAREDFGNQVMAVELTQSRYWRTMVSSTFHGRDIFAPVAAHLSMGVPLQEVGRRVESICAGVVKAPFMDDDGVLRGAIAHVDSFGNCITNITARFLVSHGFGERLSVHIAGQRLEGLYATYSAAPFGIPMALIGSSGHLELAIRNGGAARALGVIAGDRLFVKRD